MSPNLDNVTTTTFLRKSYVQRQRRMLLILELRGSRQGDKRQPTEYETQKQFSVRTLTSQVCSQMENTALQRVPTQSVSRIFRIPLSPA